MKTKKEQLLEAILADNIPAALRIAKDFRLDFTKDEQRILQIAHESQNPSGAKYYKQLGINVSEAASTAKQLLLNYQRAKS